MNEMLCTEIYGIIFSFQNKLYLFLIFLRLCGTYEALKGGQTSEAMEDFTGGVTETFVLAKQNESFFKVMVKAEERQSLMCCSIDAKPNEVEAKMSNGLIKGHAYTVTRIRKVSCMCLKQMVKMIRIRVMPFFAKYTVI